MKKLIFVFSVMTAFAISCSESNIKPESETILNISPWELGKHHNELLSIMDKEIENVAINSIEDISSKQAEIFDRYTSDNKISGFSINQGTTQLFDKINESYASKISRSTSGRENSIANHELSIELIEDAKELYSKQEIKHNLVDSEIEIINELVNSFEQYENDKDIDKVKTSIQVAKAKFKTQAFDFDKREGLIAATVISITESSIEYWSGYTYTDQNGRVQVAPWAAADAVGAAVGAGTSILADVLDDEDVDWTDALSAGLGGAVGASLPGGKGLAKAIKKLF